MDPDGCVDPLVQAVGDLVIPVPQLTVYIINKLYLRIIERCGT